MSTPLGSSQFFLDSSAAETGQSLRFEDGDSAYLSRTPASAGNLTTWTWSGWVKRGNISEGYVFSAGTSLTELFYIQFTTNYEILILWRDGSSTSRQLKTNAVYRDPSAWYHICLKLDASQSTAADRMKLFVNGVEETSFQIDERSTLSSSSTLCVNSNVLHTMGVYAYSLSTPFYDGYLANVCFIDGQALDPTSFGEYKTGTTLWKPKDVSGLTFGTNGFFLNFSDSADIGADTSGNGNDWTPTNLAATDVVLDGPYTGGNFATLSTIDKYSSAAISEGNLEIGTNTNAWYHQARATMFVNSGKWYWEVYWGGSGGFWKVGIRDNNAALTSNTTSSTGYEYYASDGNKHSSSGASSYTTESVYTPIEVLGFALDMDAGTITMYSNGVSQGVMFSGLSGYYAPTCSMYNGTIWFNFGQDSSFAGRRTPQGNTDDNGIGDFAYAPPSGFLALNTANMSEPDILLPEDYFKPLLYTGTGATQSITGLGWQPDFVWIKNRTEGYNHRLYDVIRGATYWLSSSGTTAETLDATELTSFDSDGFSVGSGVRTNKSGNAFVAWNWLTDNTTGSSNTSGSVTSTVSANPTAGFSIVTYTGNGTSGATIGHGLGTTPNMIIVKNRDNGTTGYWYTWHSSLTTNYNVQLNQTGAQFNPTLGAYGGINDPTSTTFKAVSGTVNIGGVNTTSEDYVAYCFAEVAGFSAIGKYTGNGSADGPMVFTNGIRPAFVMVKNINASSQWIMFDAERDTYNVTDARLRANSSLQEATQTFADFLSNGFKIRGTGTDLNNSGQIYIYLAFAESPFKYANAR